MKYKEILNEASNSDLYHFTLNLYKVIYDNSLGNPNKKFVSLTRDVNHMFYETHSILLVLDGIKLSHHYRMHPHYGDVGQYGDREAEERIYKKIYPLSSYLKEIVLQSEFFSAENLPIYISKYSEQYGIKISTTNFGSPGWFRRRARIDHIE
jgi:hypothetical protein